MPRFVIQRLATQLYWAGANRFVATPSAALWFEKRLDAEHRALNHLPDKREDWAVRELDDDATRPQ